uniref:NUDE domain-containing protein n=2 Tax=Clastoptera arizonana TaxID=38151 RepID=A0A1B6CEM2_9HEMI
MTQFKDKDEEILHWKGRSEELEKELEEFRESSQEYERELESSLEQSDKAIRDCKLQNNRLQFENDKLRDKLEEVAAEILELQEELSHFRSREEQYVKYIRELEQKNDDLERAHRAMYVSLGEFESKLNASIERNVLLESELDEKETLKVLVQRLKDETRDLKQEMKVIEREKTADHEKPPAIQMPSSRIVDSNQIIPPIANSPLKTISQPQNQNIRITPLTRFSAMDIVGDLLRKVGALESKLALAHGRKDSVKETPLTEGIRENRTRTLNRGISTPTISSLSRS